MSVLALWSFGIVDGSVERMQLQGDVLFIRRKRGRSRWLELYAHPFARYSSFVFNDLRLAFIAQKGSVLRGDRVHLEHQDMEGCQLRPSPSLDFLA
jgi:hypothetical protein